jgi:hypothetical protein
MIVEITLDDTLLNNDLLKWLQESSNESKSVALRIGYHSLNHALQYNYTDH